MWSEIRGLLRDYRRKLLLTFNKFLLKLLRPILKRITYRCYIQYNSSKVKDGFGAQLHRIFSISLSAEILGIKIIRPTIKDVTLHPSDSFSNIQSLKKYLRIIDTELFESEFFFDRHVLNNPIVYSFDSLRLLPLICKCMQSVILNKEIILLVCEAHKIADLIPDEYEMVISKYFEQFRKSLSRFGKDKHIVVHYRSGPGNYAIYPGQKISRQIPLHEMLSNLEKVLSNSSASYSKLTVFTDSPERKLEFYPPKEQLELWKNTPGFDGQKVTYLGLDLESELIPFCRRYGLALCLDRSSDFVAVLGNIASADLVHMSRSSLSYVGALLNTRGIIYYAQGFWHSKLRRWLQ